MEQSEICKKISNQLSLLSELHQELFEEFQTCIENDDFTFYQSLYEKYHQFDRQCYSDEFIYDGEYKLGGRIFDSYKFKGEVYEAFQNKMVTDLKVTKDGNFYAIHHKEGEVVGYMKGKNGTYFARIDRYTHGQFLWGLKLMSDGSLILGSRRNLYKIDIEKAGGLSVDNRIKFSIKGAHIAQKNSHQFLALKKGGESEDDKEELLEYTFDNNDIKVTDSFLLENIPVVPKFYTYLSNNEILVTNEIGQIYIIDKDKNVELKHEVDIDSQLKGLRLFGYNSVLLFYNNNMALVYKDDSGKWQSSTVETNSDSLVGPFQNFDCDVVGNRVILPANGHGIQIFKIDGNNIFLEKVLSCEDMGLQVTDLITSVVAFGDKLIIGGTDGKVRILEGVDEES